MKTTILLLSLSLISITYAADPPSNGQIRIVCKADIQQQCADVKPGGGRLIACLKENKDKLSDSCKTQLEKASAQRQANGKNNNDTNDDSK